MRVAVEGNEPLASVGAGARESVAWLAALEKEFVA